MSIHLLKEMFSEMVEKKNADLIENYYHPEFKLFANGQIWDFEKFHSFHVDIYDTPITYKVAYDEETLMESGDKIAARLWITTQLPDEPAREIEVVLIAHYLEKKLHRLWELTWPDWSKMVEFENVS
jgi:hypothetical protein